MALLCEQLGCELCDTRLSTDLEPTKLPAQRFDLAVVANTLEHCDRSAGEKLLGQLRNLHANHLVIVYQRRPNSEWQAAHFYALGLHLKQTFENNEAGEPLELYTYDIESYNHKREWNTARFWANPENFGKYWW